jgi:hypothetical protein
VPVLWVALHVYVLVSREGYLEQGDLCRCWVMFWRALSEAGRAREGDCWGLLSGRGRPSWIRPWIGYCQTSIEQCFGYIQDENKFNSNKYIENMGHRNMENEIMLLT